MTIIFQLKWWILRPGRRFENFDGHFADKRSFESIDMY